MTYRKKFNILIVDDDRNLGETVAHGLRRAFGEEVSIDVSYSGTQAISLSEITAYDLVISDFSMAGMSGLELLTHLRLTHPDTVLILMTAYGTDELERDAKRVADAYIQKPFELSALIAFIRRLLQEEETGPKRHIMVLEDDPYLRRLMEKVFRNGGLEIHPAGTIMAAKELLTSNRFDALLADIHLPDGKGTDLVREFRDKLSGDGTVVVMVTGESRFRYLEEELGIDLYLEKPVAVQDLVALVNRLTSAAAKAGFQ